MILSEDCKKCMYGYTIKCKNGDEYIACHMQRCQEEKKQKEGEK